VDIEIKVVPPMLTRHFFVSLKDPPSATAHMTYMYFAKGSAPALIRTRGLGDDWFKTVPEYIL
jgi:hypothetical protein